MKNYVNVKKNRSIVLLIGPGRHSAVKRAKSQFSNHLIMVLSDFKIAFTNTVIRVISKTKTVFSLAYIEPVLFSLANIQVLKKNLFVNRVNPSR